ncbi:MAG TPA: cysteine desulfurase family protein [Longimicrobiales bacterium]|nr:cysteine desulfurase family protein [Longimicrobiales bacterium]
MTNDAIYLDHAATTPVRPEVREVMAPYYGERWGNPSSTHRWGREARVALEEARERVAAALGAARTEILFTSGGTESDNLAILGRWRTGDGGVVCSAIEHRAVLDATRTAARGGAAVQVLGVDHRGVVDLAELDETLHERPAVVSVMWGNNEVGTIQPVAAIAERCRAAGVVCHTDAVQAFGRVAVRVDETPVDLVSVSGHKIGGPKGVGALFLRSGVRLEPLLWGGGQERDLRPGTQNVAGAVALATAAELAVREREDEAVRQAALRDRLQAGLAEAIAGLTINGAGAARLPHVLNVSIPAVDQEMLLASLDVEGIAASSGSACHSGAVEPSHVLVAMGQAVQGAASLRFSLGRTTSEADIDRAVGTLPRVVTRLREAAGSVAAPAAEAGA